MERKIIPWVLFFGFIMIGIGHYKRMQEYEDIKKKGMDDPLIQAIEDHVKQEESSDFTGILTGGGKLTGSVAPNFSVNNTEGGVSVPEDAFTVPVEGGSYGGSRIFGERRYDGGASASQEEKEAVEVRSRLQDIKDAPPVQQNFYPPAAEGAGAADSSQPSQPKTYYPPVAAQ